METTTDWSTGENRILRIWETATDGIRTEALQDMLLQQLGAGDVPDDVVRSVRFAERSQIELWLEQIADPEDLERVRAHWTRASRAESDRTRKTLAGRLREETLRDMLLKQFGIRFGDLSDEAVALVRAAEEAQLMGWVRRLVHATAIKDVFSE